MFLERKGKRFDDRLWSSSRWNNTVGVEGCAVWCVMCAEKDGIIVVIFSYQQAAVKGPLPQLEISSKQSRGLPVFLYLSFCCCCTWWCFYSLLTAEWRRATVNHDGTTWWWWWWSFSLRAHTHTFFFFSSVTAPTSFLFLSFRYAIPRESISIIINSEEFFVTRRTAIKKNNCDTRRERELLLESRVYMFHHRLVLLHFIKK